jgi:putative ABC transport system permease protein
MSSRPLARLAWRDVRRRPLRTALVAAIVGVPFAAMLLLNVILATSDRHLDLEMGRAQSVVMLTGVRGEPQRPDPLSDGDVVLEDRSVVVDIGGEQHVVRAVVGDVDDPMVTPKFAVADGRLPAADREVALSTGWIERYGGGVGDLVSLGAAGDQYRVVGAFHDRTELREVSINVRSLNTGVVDGYRLFSSESSSDRIASLASANDSVGLMLRGDGAGLPPEVRFATHMASMIVLMVIGLFISAAFASSARRQLRDVGLIAANGADPRHVRTTFCLQGAFTALAGLALGAVLFAAVIAVFADRLRWLVGEDIPLAFLVPDLVIAVISVVVAATLSSWWAARSVARAPVLAALAGRKPVRPPRRAVPFVGLVLGAVGLAMLGADVDSAGSVLMASGMLVVAVALCASWLVSVAGRAAGRLGGVPRLVGRQFDRQRARTGPLVASMAVTASLGIVVLIASASEASGGSTSQSPDVVDVGWYGGELAAAATAEIVTEIRRVVPSATVIVERSIVVDGEPVENWMLTADTGGGPIRAVDPDLSVLPDDIAQALRNGFVVSSLDDGGAVAIGTQRWGDDGEPEAIVPLATLPVYRADVGGYLVPAGALDDAAEPGVLVGLQLRDQRAFAGRQIAAVSDVVDDAAESWRLQRALTGSASLPKDAYVTGVEPNDDQLFRWLQYVALFTAGLLLLAAVAFGMSLSRVEQREDEVLLAALGASPRVRRLSAAVEALGMCGMAMLIAVPLGSTVAVVLRRAIGGDVTVPFGSVAGFALVVPVLAAAVFAICQRSPRRLTLTPH